MREILNLPLIKGKIENKDHKTDRVNINVYFKHNVAVLHLHSFSQHFYVLTCSLTRLPALISHQSELDTVE